MIRVHDVASASSSSASFLVSPLLHWVPSYPELCIKPLSSAHLAGVDISQPRLNQCRGAVRRHALPNVRLLEADACTLDEPPPAPEEFCASGALHSSCLPERKQRAAAARAARAAERRRCRGEGEQEGGRPACAMGAARAGYDLVLVDAECSADGSVPHMRRMLQLQRQARREASPQAEAKLAAALEYFRCQSAPDARGLRAVQAGLLANGFRLLAPGGALLYATCSARAAENESVVQAFLEDNKGVAGPEAVDTGGVPAERVGTGGVMAYLSPLVSGCSGMFLAKVRKLTPLA